MSLRFNIEILYFSWTCDKCQFNLFVYIFELKLPITKVLHRVSFHLNYSLDSTTYTLCNKVGRVVWKLFSLQKKINFKQLNYLKNICVRNNFGKFIQIKHNRTSNNKFRVIFKYFFLIRSQSKPVLSKPTYWIISLCSSIISII